MKTKHFPLFGLLLAALVAAAAMIPGALTGDGGAVAEAVAQEQAGATFVADTTAVEETVLGADEEQMVANCRYGTATDKFSGYQKWVDDLGAGWWLDFQVNYTEPADNGAEYAHLIWVEQAKDADGNYLNGYLTSPSMDRDSLGYLLLRRPGRMWILGNEVDRGPDPGQISGGQGDTMPEMYARIYHDLYYYIKAWDPTALVTPSALVQVTPGRIQYLDKVWNAYKALYGEQMPVDLWNIHLYILAELRRDGNPSYFSSIALGTDPALGMLEFGGDVAECGLDNVYCVAEHDSIDAFSGQVRRMRTWMKAHGYKDKPLIITEYSLLLPYELRPEPEGCWVKDEFGNCFTPERVRDFAAASFNYLETATDPDLGYQYDNDRLVQQWLWYGMYRTGLGKTSNLAAAGAEPLSLTPAGQAFAEATRAEAAYVNLFPTEANNPGGSIGVGGHVSARLTVAIRNNGNTRVNEPITVTFYGDEDLTQVLGTKTIQAPDEDFPGMTGCAVRPIWVSVDATWENGITPGEHRYWAKVDSSGSIDESDETDNVISGVILLVPVGSFLPLVMR